jgi:hypothetical protein
MNPLIERLAREAGAHVRTEDGTNAPPYTEVVFTGPQLELCAALVAHECRRIEHEHLTAAHGGGDETLREMYVSEARRTIDKSRAAFPMPKG